MTKDQKRAIEANAVNAAVQGLTPNEACPWPFASEEALLWVAAWAVAKGTVR